MYVCNGFVEEGGRWRIDERILSGTIILNEEEDEPFWWLLAPMEDACVCGTVSGVCGLSIESGGIYHHHHDHHHHQRHATTVVT